MRVLVVSNLFPPHHVGGYELRCAELVRALARAGHPVAVLTSNYGVSPNGKVAPSDGGGPSEPPVRRILQQYVFGPEQPRPRPYLLGSIARQLADARRLTALLDEFRPDVVNWWSLSGLSKALLPIPRARGIPDVFCVDDTTIAEELGPSGENEKPPWTRLWTARHATRPWHPAMNYVLRRWGHRLRREGISTSPVPFAPAHVCFVSHFMQEAHVAAGFRFASTEVIHGGVAVDAFRPDLPRVASPGSPLRLLYVGAITENRGIETAIEALGLLEGPAGEAATLSVVGADPEHGASYLATVRDIVTRLGLGDRVRFCGSVPYEHMPGVYRDHDLLLAPSKRAEGLPRNLIEAMLSGCVPLTTGSGGAGEIARVANLPVFPPDDAHALSRLIMRLAEQPAAREALARRGQRLAAEHFSLIRSNERMLAMLERVAARARRAR